MTDNITRVFVILGILMFAKQAPKLIGDLFGFDGSNMGLGIKKKLSEGLPSSAKGAAGAIGAGIGGASRNVKNAVTGFNDKGKTRKEKAAMIGNALKSGTGGLIGGTKRGYGASKSAKDWKELKAGMNKGADDSVEARNDRASYKATHPGKTHTGLLHGTRDFLSGQKEVMKGHVKDFGEEVETFLLGGTASEKNAKATKLDTVSNASKELNTILDDSNNVKAVNAFYEQLRKDKASAPITSLDYSKHYTDPEKTEIANRQKAIASMKDKKFSTEDIAKQEQELKNLVGTINSNHEKDVRVARTKEMVQIEEDYTTARNDARADAAVVKLTNKDVKFTAALSKLSETISENQAVVTESGVADAANFAKQLDEVVKMEVPDSNKVKKILTTSGDVTKKTGAKAFEYKTEAAKDEKK